MLIIDNKKIGVVCLFESISNYNHIIRFIILALMYLAILPILLLFCKKWKEIVFDCL